MHRDGNGPAGTNSNRERLIAQAAVPYHRGADGLDAQHT
jgi:hypothetical protein